MDSPMLQSGQATAQAVREQTYDKMSAALFKGWDGNRDRHVTPDEYQTNAPFPTAPFESVDTDGDGALSQGEVFEVLGQEARQFFADAHRQQFDGMDRNGNGQVDKRELKGVMRAGGKTVMTSASFSRYDVDKDAQLSFAEFETYALEKAIKQYVPKIS